MSPAASACTDVELLLSPAGVHVLLQQLNARTRFRFTAVLTSHLATREAVLVFDRENPLVRCVGGENPLDVGVSYVSVPIRRRSGVSVGVLCHYDFRPRLISAEGIVLLEHAARRLTSWISS